jgi:hypothetical protein
MYIEREARGRSKANVIFFGKIRIFEKKVHTASKWLKRFR